ncbi:ABC transporter permease [Flavobacteriaceae bacterium]|nr:ABC transporter permease [Flavobacteriaceae bacterium]
MIRLLQIEWFKLFHHRISRILIISYFLLISGISLLATVKVKFGPIDFHLAEQGIFNFPYIWHFNAYMIATLKIFFAIIIVAMIANEFSYKTLKQNLIDGLSKKEFLLTKVYTILSFVIVSTFVVFLVSLILGLLYSDFNEWGIIFSDLEYLLAYAVKLFGFFSLCLFFGVWIKRSAFALGMLILWQVAEGILYGLIRWNISEAFADKANALFPLNAMGNIIKEPISRLSAIQNVADQIGEGINKNYGVDPLELLIVLVWSAIFIYGSYRILQKRDL